MVMWSVDTLPQLFEVILLNCTFLFSLIEDMIVLGSWLCCGGAWVPWCERPVPQSRLHRGSWESEQVNSIFIKQYFENANKWQDPSKRPTKPRRKDPWMGFWPKLVGGEATDGEPCLRCRQTKGVSSAELNFHSRALVFVSTHAPAYVPVLTVYESVLLAQQVL